jgi:hypothetical protein
VFVNDISKQQDELRDGYRSSCSKPLEFVPRGFTKTVSGNNESMTLPCFPAKDELPESLACLADCNLELLTDSVDKGHDDGATLGSRRRIDKVIPGFFECDFRQVAQFSRVQFFPYQSIPEGDALSLNDGL